TGHEHNNSWLPHYNYLYSSFPYLFSSRNGNRGSESGFYKNIVILNFDDTVNLAWSKVILKSQSNAAWHDHYLSYFIMNMGIEIHVLFNELERHKQVLYDQIIDADGKVSNKSILRGLNMDYQLMPCFAKQISSHEIIIPCRFKNDICFAKIDY
ncbi:MAG: hypothetical protein ACXVNN_10435, partial [Bacteroidia bacterium]